MFSSVVGGTYRKIFIIHSLTRSLALSLPDSTYLLNRSQWVCRLADSVVESSYFSHRETAEAAGAVARRSETDSCFTSSQVVYWIYSIL